MRESKYTKELLLPIVESSFSVSQVLQKLGLRNTGGNYRNIQNKIKSHEIDTSHFKGMGWSKGLTSETNASVFETTKKIRIPNDEVLIENCKHSVSSTNLRNRVLKIGLEYVCQICGIENWMSKPLTFHLDHINGNGNDHRLENLRFLCPNCHQQTDTWGNKNR